MKIVKFNVTKDHFVFLLNEVILFVEDIMEIINYVENGGNIKEKILSDCEIISALEKEEIINKNKSQLTKGRNWRKIKDLMK